MASTLLRVAAIVTHPSERHSECSANVVRAQVLPDPWPGGTLPIAMAHPAPSDPVAPPRFTAERYFALVDEGVLGPDDRVELLEGVIVAMSPRNPPHDAGVSLVCQTLIGVVGKRAAVRCQLTLVLHRNSAPEPDVAVVPGHARDYATRHPEHALLVVEVADSSLAQDRITKAAMYAAGGVPEYWILNLRDDCLEVLRAPLPEQGSYAERTVRRRGERIELAALPGVIVAVDDLLPGPA